MYIRGLKTMKNKKAHTHNNTYTQYPSGHCA